MQCFLLRALLALRAACSVSLPGREGCLPPSPPPACRDRFNVWIQTSDLVGDGASKVTPSFKLKLGSKYKLQVSGKAFRSKDAEKNKNPSGAPAGSCTDKWGNMQIRAVGKMYEQESFDSGKCEMKCPDTTQKGV